MPLDVVREEDQKRNSAARQDFEREAHIDEDGDQAAPERVAHFEDVAASMRKALGESPTVEYGPTLTQEERIALECLYAAKTAIDPQQDEFRSAVDRNHFLNQALAVFQPTLALGLEPEFPEGRPVYEELKKKVAAVRADIMQRFLLEGGAGKPAKYPKKKTDKKDDGKPPEEGEGDEPDDPDDAAGSGEPSGERA